MKFFLRFRLKSEESKGDKLLRELEEERNKRLIEL